MEILIGENIRRLRNYKKVAQEQLSEALGVTCAAVSKWERGETYPDITLLFPLAHYFDISLDELMGYNQKKIEQEIEDVLNEYGILYHSDYNKSCKLITEAYRKYPNDYRIMHSYMWNIGGDYADNDPNVLLMHKDEFLVICDKLIDGCTEEQLRLDAWNMKAKILHAEGKTDEALEIYQKKFINWYTTSGQKSEQLFAKDTPEFLYWVKKNMYQLADFAADKLVKSIFFDQSIQKGEGILALESYGDMLTNLRKKTNNAFFAVMESRLFGRLSNDMKYRGGGTPYDLARITAKKDPVREQLKMMAKNDRALADALPLL